MIRRSASLLGVAVAAAALSGCYGTKIFKGPINSEHAAMQADSIRADQRRILEQLSRLEERVNQESDQRLSSNAQLSSSLRDLEDAVRALVSRMDDQQSMNSMGGRGRTGGPRSSAPDSTTMAEQAYQAAYRDVTTGNFELASQEFQDYLTRYPDSPRVAEAHFYLGECQYAEERYLEAAGEYQKVTSDFPASRLAPAAYLKMGRSYVQLEERSLAEKAFRTLIDKHPNTEEAKQAESALKQLGG
ncbi:MAG TPA: tol-pal system protein YbgF [Candidatus Krumholzibacteria bacterium]|nr:tol-pal system protein YbgF [Candidatus Krumholzibacteria bacterium]